MINTNLPTVALLRVTHDKTGKPIPASDEMSQTYYGEFGTALKKAGANTITIDPNDVCAVGNDLYLVNELQGKGVQQAHKLNDLIDAVVISNIDLFPDLNKMFALMKVFELNGIPLSDASEDLHLILDNKRIQETYLRTSGVPIPDTLYCASPKAVSEELLKTKFADDETIIIKLSNGAFGTDVIKADGIKAAIREVKKLPEEDTEFVAFQKAVSDSMGVSTRVTAVGGDIVDICQFANTANDFRSTSDPDNCDVLPVQDMTLRQKLTDYSQKLLKLFPGMGLVGIDFLVDGNKQPWLIELNDSPYMFPFEKGTELFDKFAQYVISKAKTKS